MISIITAMDKNQLIGRDNELPWYIPEDLKFFKEKTIDQTIIMGRKTFESIGRPLPDRDHLVLTREEKLPSKGFYRTWYMDMDKVMKTISNWPSKEFFIIGGAEIYKQFLPIADKMYITTIDYEFEGNVYFPKIDWNQWYLKQRIKGIKDDKNPYDYFFQEYRRKGAML